MFSSQKKAEPNDSAFSSKIIALLHFSSRRRHANHIDVNIPNTRLGGTVRDFTIFHTGDRAWP